MSSADVRSILDLPQSSAKASATRKHAVPRKPDGISRELYALMGDNAPSITAAAPLERIRERPTKAQWRKKAFGNLYHWVDVSTDADDSRAEYFRQFDRTSPSVMTYSQAEYDQLLRDDSWTKEETAYLFDLLRQYDLRFIVTADRYEYKNRTIEDIKDRYYTVCRRLVRSRAAADPATQNQLVQAYAFDKARETRRKQYASELFHLTAAEIAEEEALYIEVKRMDQNEKRYRADRDSLLRSVMGLESGLVSLDQANGDGVVGMDKNKKRKRGEDEAPVPPPPKPEQPENDPALDDKRCIHRVAVESTGRYPAHVAAYLRSSKIAMPKPSSAIRTAELLHELGISSTRLVMPTHNNLEMYEQLVNTASMLVEMKRQVDRADQELRSLQAQSRGFIART